MATKKALNDQELEAVNGGMTITYKGTAYPYNLMDDTELSNFITKLNSLSSSEIIVKYAVSKAFSGDYDNFYNLVTSAAGQAYFSNYTDAELKRLWDARSRINH